MAQNEENIPAVVYVLGCIAGAGSAYAVVSLAQSPSLVAAVVGGLVGWFAVAGSVEEPKNLFQDWAYVFMGCTAAFWLLSLGPLLEDEDIDVRIFGWFLVVVLAVGSGLFAGDLVFKVCCGSRGSRIRSGEGMAEDEEKIPQVVYFLGFVVGAISAYAVAPEWINWVFVPLPPVFGKTVAVIGGMGAFWAVEERKSIFRALLWLLLAAGWTWLVITIIALLLPAWRDGDLDFVAGTVFVVLMMVPGAVGIFGGALVFNLWKVRGR